jgi:hypothetical protein
MISLVCGVPAISIGLGAIVVLLSPLFGKAPDGSETFYEFSNVAVAERDSNGWIVATKPVIRLLPSSTLLGMLSVGMCWAGLGIYLGRRRSPHRRVTTSAAGMLACAIAFFAVWILILSAARG